MSIEALSMVLNHSKAVGSQKVVLLGIANHLGPDATEGAWPSQKRLSDYSNMSERGVQKCIDKLVSSGELRVEVAAGHSRNQYKPNRYWITIECPPDCDRSMSHRGGELPYSEGRTPVPPGTNAGTVRDEPQFVLTVIEPLEEPSENLNSKASPKSSSAFDEWWSYYPRKEGKGAARKEFGKALKKVGLDVLVNGAESYSNDPNREPKFTVQPARWLREERWDDGPLPLNRSLTNSEKNIQNLRASMALLADNEMKEVESNESVGSQSAIDFGINLRSAEDI
jgi:hypothetical protein